jgi:hypothetical protein
MANTRVTVRGPLGFGAWTCTLMGCESGCCNGCDTKWLVVDAKSPRAGVLLQRAEEMELLGTGGGECDLPKPPRLEVMATGMLAVRPDYLHQEKQPWYILDQVSVCAVLPLPKL